MNWFYEMERQFFFLYSSGVRDNWRHTEKKVSANEEFCSVRRNNIESHKFYVADGRNPKKSSTVSNGVIQCISLWIVPLFSCDASIQCFNEHIHIYIDDFICISMEKEMKMKWNLDLCSHSSLTLAFSELKIIDMQLWAYENEKI